MKYKYSQVVNTDRLLVSASRVWNVLGDKGLLSEVTKRENSFLV